MSRADSSPRPYSGETVFHRTEQTYLHWMKESILFHDKRHPADMGVTEVEAYLTHLAVDRKVAPSTQNVAMQSVLFLYQEVLGIELTGINTLCAKKDKRLPVVLTKVEAYLDLEHMKDPTYHLQAKLMVRACACSTVCTCASKSWTAAKTTSWSEAQGAMKTG